jgi:hypothetical protein
MSNELVPSTSKSPRGAYRIGPRLERVLTGLASGAYQTISQAAEEVGISRRAVSAALQKSHVKEHMHRLINENLRAGSLRASSRLREIMEQSSNPVAALNASRYLLATGSGIVPPSPPSTSVNIAIGSDVRAGFVIDLTEPPSEPAPAPVTIDVTPTPARPVLGHVVDPVELGDGDDDPAAA